ncbi:myocardin-related transcription factor B, partial [Trichonephila inaurata madagascariensis]
SGDNQRYWDIQLDPDLLETIVSIYPEWFKDCNMNVDGRDSTDNSMCLLSSDSKAKQENGESLQRPIDKNKESLKVKLMLRRPLNQLVDQGILPSLKSPPSFHEQRQKLERAKMGDLLKHKLQKRPDRQELIQQHILEESCLDSSQQEKQKQLKNGLLADNLSGMLSQRPGSIDLVKGNIINADELLAQAVRETLPFKSTCDTPSPNFKATLDEDSGSDGAFSPSPPYYFSEHSQSSLPSLEASEPSPNPNQGSPCSGSTGDQRAEFFVQHLQHQQHGLKEASSVPNKNRKKTKPKTQPKARTIKFHEYRGPADAQKNATATPTTLTESHSELWLHQQQLFLQVQQAVVHSQVHSNHVTAVQKPVGDQIVQTVQKQNTTNQAQQLFETPSSPQKLLSNFEDLKVSDLKAELKKKGLPVSGSKPQLIKRLRSQVPSSGDSPAHTNQTIPPTTPTALSNVTSPHTITVDSILLDNLQTIPTSDVVAHPSANMDLTPDTIKSLLNSIESDSMPSTLVSMDTEPETKLELGDLSDSSSTSLSNEHIVQLQQIWIEKLQRDLERSRKQLQQCQMPVVTSSTVMNSKPSNSTPPPKASSPLTNGFKSEETPQSAENKVAQRQIIHQILQQKIQQQELQKAQRQQAVNINIPPSTSSSTNTNSTLTALLKSSPLNASPMGLGRMDLDLTSVTKPVTSFPGSIMSTQVQDNKNDVLSEDDFPTLSLQVDASNDPDEFPGVVPIFVCHGAGDTLSPKAAVLTSPNALSNRSSSLPSFSALRTTKPSPTRSNTDPQFQIARPPPNYNEATKQLKIKQHHLTADGGDGNPRQSKKHKSSVKSQAVDDVLEILISNGELSPSAAQEPTTPVTPVTTHSESASLPLFLPSSAHEPFFTKPLTTPLPPPSTAADLQLAASLQSLMDLTPPSSNSLDFDFPLDIAAMELEGLDSGHPEPSGLDQSLSMSMAPEVKSSLDFVMNKSTDLTNDLMRSTEATDGQDRGNDRGIDNDILIEWLGGYEESSTHSTTSNNFPSSSSYEIAHDPLFSNGHDTLDFFSGDDIDFKPQNDLNFLPWSENTT